MADINIGGPVTQVMASIATISQARLDFLGKLLENSAPEQKQKVVDSIMRHEDRLNNVLDVLFFWAKKKDPEGAS